MPATPVQVLNELEHRFREPDRRATFISPHGHASAKDCAAVLALIDDLAPTNIESLTPDEQATFRAIVAELRSAAKSWESGNQTLTLGSLRTPYQQRPLTILKALVSKMVTVATPAPAIAQPQPAVAAGKRAKRYGPWVLRESVGGGGQGDVYLAVHEKDRDETLRALKRLRNPDRIARFKKEIEAALRLEHPNIVRVIDHNLDEPAYLVMEYYPRGALTFDLLRSMPLVERLKLFTSICSGLAHAHDNGVTHRDIKPDNVLVGEQLLAAVTDFGLCHIKGEVRVTETRELIRNWLCTPPEFERGRPDDVTPAADVYCLGKLLYWMLSGEYCPREDHRIQDLDLTRIEPRLGHTLAYELLDRMIVHNPKERFQTAGEVLTELTVLTKRAEMNSHAIDLDAPQPCTFCGQGEYKIAVDPRHWTGEGNKEAGRAEIFRLGLGFNGNSAVLVLLCDYCGNLQVFMPTHNAKGHKGGLGNWTPRSLRR